MIQILIDNAASIIGYLLGGGGLLMWFFEKRKYNQVVVGMESENKAKEIENDSKKVQLYKDILDDLSIRYENKYKDLEAAYERKTKLLEEEISLKERIISNLKKEVRDLKKIIRDYENSKHSK